LRKRGNSHDTGHRLDRFRRRDTYMRVFSTGASGYIGGAGAVKLVNSCSQRTDDLRIPPLQLNHSIRTATRIVANRLLSTCSMIVSVVLPLRWRAQPKISPIKKMQRMPSQ
jgi:hypothetical protein